MFLSFSLWTRLQPMRHILSFSIHFPFEHTFWQRIAKRIRKSLARTMYTSRTTFGWYVWSTPWIDSIHSPTIPHFKNRIYNGFNWIKSKLFAVHELCRLHVPNSVYFALLSVANAILGEYIKQIYWWMVSFAYSVARKIVSLFVNIRICSGSIFNVHFHVFSFSLSLFSTFCSFSMFFVPFLLGLKASVHYLLPIIHLLGLKCVEKNKNQKQNAFSNACCTRFIYSTYSLRQCVKIGFIYHSVGINRSTLYVQRIKTDDEK